MNKSFWFFFSKKNKKKHLFLKKEAKTFVNCSCSTISAGVGAQNSHMRLPCPARRGDRFHACVIGTAGSRRTTPTTASARIPME
jgi:hypothetical protein